MKFNAQGWHRAETRFARSTARVGPPEFVSFTELVRFDEFVALAEPELRRFIARKVRPEAVDDLLQEVWVAAWQGLPTYDRRSKFRTWVYGICIHKCLDYYRSQKGAERFVPLNDQPLIDPQPSPEHTVIQADTVSRLLADLDETQRTVLELYYYAQLTLAEIADVLDRNVNTVKYQFYRAHSTLLAASGSEEER